MILIDLSATIPREIIACLHIILLVTNEHTKKISPWLLLLRFYWRIKIRKSSEAHFLTSCAPLMMELFTFSYSMLFLVGIWIYMQKIVSLGVVVNFWPPVTSTDFPWPLVTSNDHRIQMYISYIFSSTHVCIHAKNCVSGCCECYIIKNFGFKNQ